MHYLKDKTIVLAYSGGLDTSFCIPYFIREKGAKVVAAIVDTGGIDQAKRAELEERAIALGAERFECIDGKPAMAERVLRYLIAGNVRRGDTYPLCVAAERAIQAELLVEYAKTQNADAIAHGSTGAGNDQIRFEVAIRAIAPKILPLAPVRDMELSREDEVSRLEGWGLDQHLSKETKSIYSINRGLWGITIGGQETSSSELPLPNDAYVLTTNPADAPDSPQVVKIGFEAGMPISLDGEKLDSVTLIEKLDVIAGAHGVGRGMHLGDTIIGIKGRVAYESPAADTLLPAHRELEKLVLTRHQQRIKAQASAYYGDLVHESAFFDPAARDIEAMLASSQSRVTGVVEVSLFKGNATVLGVSSPYSLMKASGATYGEELSGYSGADAAGFSRILGNASRIIAVAGKQD